VASPLTEPLAGFARSGGAALARFFGVDVRAGTEAGQLICTGAAGAQSVRVCGPCSGVNGLLAVLVLGVPVALEAEGPARRKAVWIAAGAAAVLLFAPVRVAILCGVAAGRGTGAAFSMFHLIGGTAFFVIAWAAMLGSALALSIRRPVLAARTDDRLLPHGAEGKAFLAALVAFSIFAGAGNARMFARLSLPEPETPPVNVDVGDPESWAVPIDCYERWRHRSLTWVKPTFGPDSRMERFVYAPEEGGRFWVDVLVVTDFSKLREHTMLGCYNWHEYQVADSETFDLSARLPARRFVVVDGLGRRWMIASWIEPAAFADGPGWRRTVVVRRSPSADEDAATGAAVIEFARSFRRASSAGTTSEIRGR
jgi:exosortase/archaeosortase family protein